MEGGVTGRDRFAGENAAIGKVTVEIQSVDGDDKVAQPESIILSQCCDQGPWSGRAGALAQDMRRSGIEGRDLPQNPTNRRMELVAGMSTVQGGYAVN